MRKTLSAATLLAVLSAPTFAATMGNFNYDYFDARVGFDPLTYGGEASMSIHPNAHALGRIDSKFEGDYDAAAGIGFHAPINDWADLTGDALFHLVDAGDDDSEHRGVELTFGVRQWLGPQLEVHGEGGYQSIDDNEEWIGAAGARFYPTELFSIGMEYRLNQFYDDQLMATARFVMP
ncbi:hypothetical protein N9R79_06285 [Vibrio sp.]|nr:hypothetical protein [Vibrio sp.]